MERVINLNKDNMSGKGSKPRPYKIMTYENNYDEIDWHRKDSICGYKWLKDLEPKDLEKPGLVPIRKIKKHD
jgi:hypothetical protein